MTKTLRFKTNLMCNGCKTRITPFLDEKKEIESWELDLESADKVLTVNVAGLQAQEVIDILGKVGYEGELLK